MAENRQKRTSKQLRNFFFILTVAFFLLMAVLEYFRIIRITDNLARKEADALIQHVQISIDAATYSEEVIRENITDHLYSIAYLLKEQAACDIKPDYSEFALLSDVNRIDVYNSSGIWINGSLKNDKLKFPDSSLIPTTGEQWEKTIGIFSPAGSDVRYYSIAISYMKNGIILVSIDAEELLAMRQNVGLGALLEDLDQHPEVRYALLESPDGILAATPDLPKWIKPVEVYPTTFKDKTSILELRSVNTSEGRFYEAMAFYDEISQIYLRLGIKNEELDKIINQNILALLLRTGSILVVSLLLFILLIQRQNVRLLEEERERIQKEVQVLEADKNTRKRLAAMGELAGGVAHEIRNPLNTVGMAAQRLEYEYEPAEDKEGYKQLIHSLKEETKRIGRIIADFLEYARPPKANKQKQPFQPAIQQVLDTFNTMAEAKNVKFDYKFEKEFNFAFDADQVRQALLNLLKNSLDEMTNSSGQISAEFSQDKHFVYAKIIDNGPGIPPEKLEHIFDLYYTSKADGMGIGLPTVHRIAVEHGGRVEYSDTPDGGATFTLLLKKD